MSSIYDIVPSVAKPRLMLLYGTRVPPRALRRMDLDKYMHLLCLELLKSISPFISTWSTSKSYATGWFGGFTTVLQKENAGRKDNTSIIPIAQLILYIYYTIKFKKSQNFYVSFFLCILFCLE